MDRRQFNVIHVGAAFLVLFSADFTITSMQKTINKSISDDDPDYHVDGYATLAITYLTYAVSLLLAPSIVAVLGPRYSFVVGSSGMALYYFLFSLENKWIPYFGVIMAGFGGSILWVNEGDYMVKNADERSLTKDVSIFWATYTAAMFLGNTYVTIEFAGLDKIDSVTRHHFMYVMTALAVTAIVIFIFVGQPLGVLEPKSYSPRDALKYTIKILKTKSIGALIVTFCYSGFQQSFGWGVYAACVGFTNLFGTMTVQLVPLTALVFGVGDCIGGLANMGIRLSSLNWKRRYIFAGGVLLQTIAYFGIVLNIPNSAVFAPTYDASFIQPQIWLALLCSFFLGLGDSCINTQIYSLLGKLHPEYSSQTAALYKFSKSLAMVAFFVASIYTGLHPLVIVTAVFGIVGAAAFFWVDCRLDNSILSDQITSKNY